MAGLASQTDCQHRKLKMAGWDFRDPFKVLFSEKKKQKKTDLLKKCSEGAVRGLSVEYIYWVSRLKGAFHRESTVICFNMISMYFRL